MTFRDMKHTQKVFLTIAIFVLMGFELGDISRDRADAQRSQTEALKQNREGFAEIANGLKTAIKETTGGFTTTLSKMQGLADLSTENLNTITGGNGYCVMYFSYISVMRDGKIGARVTIGNMGKYPLYGVHALITDLDEHDAVIVRSGLTIDVMNAGSTDLTIGDLAAKPYGIMWPSPVVISQSNKNIRLAVRFSSARGVVYWTELVHIRRVGTDWSEALQVSRYDSTNDKLKILQTDIQPRFPRAAGENLWK